MSTLQLSAHSEFRFRYDQIFFFDQSNSSSYIYLALLVWTFSFFFLKKTPQTTSTTAYGWIRLTGECGVSLVSIITGLCEIMYHRCGTQYTALRIQGMGSFETLLGYGRDALHLPGQPAISGSYQIGFMGNWLWVERALSGIVKTHLFQSIHTYMHTWSMTDTCGLTYACGYWWP